MDEAENGRSDYAESQKRAMRERKPATGFQLEDAEQGQHGRRESRHISQKSLSAPKPDYRIPEWIETYGIYAVVGAIAVVLQIIYSNSA
jgi:hypothetical protein